MKRLVKKAQNKYESYISIIRELMNNDGNSSWDEIYNEYMEEYNDENEALELSISEVIETLERILSEDLDAEGDKETYDFYKDQLDKLVTL